MTDRDIDDLVHFINRKRMKKKRCETCCFLKMIKKTTYLIGGPTYIYKCLYTGKIFNTEWMFSWGRKGCFCKFYKPEFVSVEDYKESNEN